MSAELMLGRARKQTIVIDEGRPRNAVTREAHGFLTRDGISPSEFRRIAKEQLRVYPSVSQAKIPWYRSRVRTDTSCWRQPQV